MHPNDGADRRIKFFDDGPPIPEGEKLVPQYGANGVDDDREAFSTEETEILDRVWLSPCLADSRPNP